jgi:hypothetical protein
MKTIRILGLAVAAAAVALLLSMSPASAQPVAGAYYAGEITGGGEPPCGTVDFTVSGDGSQVVGFTAYDVPGVGCVFQGPQYYPVPLAIVGNSFGPGIPGMYEVSGSFPSEGSAQGTLRLVVYGSETCDTGVLNWTAITTTPSPTPVGGIAELPDVSESAARSYIALAELAAAALVALSAGVWYARRRWLS